MEGEQTYSLEDLLDSSDDSLARAMDMHRTNEAPARRTSREFLGLLLTGEITGASIGQNYPNDLHFVCGCANFDPLGNNDTFRALAREHFCEQIQNESPAISSGQCKVRAEVEPIMERAHARAKIERELLESRFRVWKPNLPSKKRLNESNWEDACFVDITENTGSLKKNLEWPLRRALEDARKQCAVEATFENEQTSQVPVPQQEPRAKRAKCETPDDVVKTFVDKYNEQEYLEALERIHLDRGTRNIEDWAKDLYIFYREHPEDPRAKGLNMDRKTLLNLLYDLVRAWEKHAFSAEFEQAIDCIFKTRRLVRILSVCLPMDRAQSLYKMRNGTDTRHGMHWYSKHHLEADNAYARDHPEEQMQWICFIGSYSGSPTMNRKLFRLLFSDRLGLRSNSDFRRWSRPAKRPEH